MTTAKARIDDFLERWGGDSADFGFWPDWHQMMVEHKRSAKARTIGGKEWLPEAELWLEVNDHGNVAVYADDNGQPGEVLWSHV